MLPILILGAGATVLHGQAIVEYGVGAGRSGAAGAAAGKSVVKVLGNLDKTLAGAAKADEAPPPTQTLAIAAPASAPTAVAPAVATTAKFDLTGIAVGMDRADLLKKAGKSSMTISSMESSTLVETCWYRAGEDNVKVILRNGKVASISGAGKLAAK